MRRRRALVALGSVALIATCVAQRRALLEVALDRILDRAHRPSPWRPKAGEFELLAGDLHCHVQPPDLPEHVSRTVDQTLAAVEKSDLDFLVLTPHVGARFYVDDEHRAAVVDALEGLRRRIPSGRPIVDVGFEYTDFSYGHVGFSFADLAGVLADVPASAPTSRFVERWVERGGLVTLNHPLVTPLESRIPQAREDMSFRPWTFGAVVDTPWRAHAAPPWPEEIAAVDRLFQGAEVYNAFVSELRDRLLIGDREASLRATATRMDREIRARHRRLAFVGGSDSHGAVLRATTFVLARGRTARAIRDAIVEGRTCVRDPVACSFEIRTGPGAWSPVGAALAAEGAIEIRTEGTRAEIFVDGEIAARASRGEIARVPIDASCHVVRAHVDDGWSGPSYVGCDLDP
jgi:hypothetical protein